jgi:hypothetical protein
LELFRQCDVFVLDFGTVPTVWKNTTLSEQFQNVIEKHHTLGTVPKSNRKIVETDKIDISTIQIHEHSISLNNQGTSVKRGELN